MVFGNSSGNGGFGQFQLERRFPFSFDVWASLGTFVPIGHFLAEQEKSDGGSRHGAKLAGEAAGGNLY